MAFDNKTAVVITAEDKTAAGFASVRSSVSGLAGSFGALLNPITLAGTAMAAATAGMVASVKSAIDAGDQFAKLSQKTGLTVEALSALDHAANLSGVPLESLAKGIQKLSVSMNDAAVGASVKTVGAFKALGVSVKDASGGLRASDDVLGDIADRFAGMEDGAGKTALAIAIFGRAGADLIPLLNGGRDGMKEMTAEAEKLGLVMSTETAKASEKFNDNMQRLGSSVTALGRTLATDLIGPMADLTAGLVAATKASGGLISGLLLLDGGQLANPVRGLEKAEAALANLKKTRDEMADSFVGRNISSFVADDLAILDAQISSKEKQIIALRDLSSKVAQGGSQGQIRAFDLANAPKTAAPTFGGSETAAKKTALDRALEDQRKRLAGLGADAGDEQGVSVDSVARQYASKESAAIEKLRDKYVELADPLQKYRDQLDEINKLRELGAANGGLTAEQAIEAAWAVNDAMDAQIEKTHDLGEAVKETNNFARDLGLTFSSAFEDAAISGKNFSEVLQGLAKDIQRILLRKTVTEPFGKAVSGLFENFDISSIFGGGRASGGPVSAGQYYVVGENGPEILVPGSSGTVLPNRAAGGGNMNIVVNNTAAPDVTATATARNNGGGFDVEVIVQRAIANDMTRNGPITQAMGSMFGLQRAV